MDRATAVIKDTYLPYVSQKFKKGVPHVCDVVETSTLAYTSPPDVTYNLELINHLELNNKTNTLSIVQLEGIVYACQKHVEMLPNGSRAGFFLADSTGLGKGRIISGVILENLLNGRRKSIWITLSTDLFVDCQRDFNDVSKNLKHHCYSTNTDMLNLDNGTLFATYATLSSMKKREFRYRNSKAFVFCTHYDRVKGWLGKDFEGVIAFDECHRGKGIEKTNIGQMIMNLQRDFPNARILYVSATAATIPQELGYMSRLGLWGPGTSFRTVKEFEKTMESRGLGSMEALAVQLKHTGFYLSRQLSMKGVDYEIVHIPQNEPFEQMYNECTVLWNMLRESLQTTGTNHKIRRYWSSHQLFFSTLCFSSKIDKAAEYAKYQVLNKKSVVIGIQRTGESRYLKFLKRGNFCKKYSLAQSIIEYVFTDLLDFDIYGTARVESLDAPNVANKLSSSSSDSDSDSEISSTSSSSSSTSSSESTKEKVEPKRIKIVNLDCPKHISEALNLFNRIKHQLPMNPIDQLIKLLGGPDAVAEMTGRKSRHEQVYESESESEEEMEFQKVPRKAHTTDRNTNLKEKALFQSGKKRFAIISDASSSGISLHSDRIKGGSTHRRVQITLEVPWSADKVIQQFGRTHRSNQDSPPMYVFMQSFIPGEERFIWAITERLASMTAITRGDRNASQSAFITAKQINTGLGATAVHKLFRYLGGEIPFAFPITFSNAELKDAKENLVKIGLLDEIDSQGRFQVPPKNQLKVSKFLNRMLGCTLSSQRVITSLFYNTMQNLMERAVKAKSYDEGILDLRYPETTTASVKCTTKFPQLRPVVMLHEIRIDHGLTWNQVLSIKCKNESATLFKRAGRVNAEVIFTYEANGSHLYVSPNDGKERIITTSHLSLFTSLSMEDANDLWIKQHSTMNNYYCLHKFMNGECAMPDCNEGARLEEICLVSGNLNAVWDMLGKFTNENHLTIARLNTNKGYIVGVVYSSKIGLKVEEELWKKYRR